MEHEKSKPQATALIKFCFLAPLIMIFLLASEQNPRGTRGGVGGGGLGAEDALTLTSSPKRLRPG